MYVAMDFLTFTIPALNIEVQFWHIRILIVEMVIGVYCGVSSGFRFLMI